MLIQVKVSQINKLKVYELYDIYTDNFNNKYSLIKTTLNNEFYSEAKFKNLSDAQQCFHKNCK